jgi:Replication Fork Protection Component Swi3
MRLLPQFINKSHYDTPFKPYIQLQCKGRGHEVSDLRRLLEMYKRWQDRVFPTGEFDGFIADLEKLSNTNVVKKEIHEMRMHVVKVL